MKVLIVDDNQLIAMTIARHLKTDYRTDIAHDGSQALNMAFSGRYDVIILDLGLPDIDGLELCKLLREQLASTPIIVSSGRSKIETKVSLLNSGADDYMVKPYNLEELRVRIQGIVRRTNNTPSSGGIIAVDDLTLEPYSQKVMHGGRQVVLRKKEYEILSFLMHNQNIVLTREVILDHIWDTSQTLWPNVVDVHIKYLRDKIDRPFGTELIKTVRGVGYVMQSQDKRASRRGYIPTS